MAATKRSQEIRFSNEMVFTEKSSYPRHRLKERIIKENLIEYKCEICNNIGEHNNISLCLQLDHINGINNDHRLENLRFLCLNCHSQQHTYAAKNRKNVKRQPKRYYRRADGRVGNSKSPEPWDRNPPPVHKGPKLYK